MKMHENNFFKPLGFTTVNANRTDESRPDLSGSTVSNEQTSRGNTTALTHTSGNENTLVSNSTVNNGENNPQSNIRAPNNTSHIQSKKDVELLIFIDSNRKHIDWRKFWKINGSEKCFCGNLWNIREKIEKENVGVNDLDRQDANEVFQQLVQIINIIRQKFVNTKITLSEITPRMDDRDQEVKKCNILINQFGEENDYIFIARHSNLRDLHGTMFDDDKHITINAVPRFVSNIKRALEKAYGIVKPQGRKQQDNYRFNRTNRTPIGERFEAIAGYGREPQKQNQLNAGDILSKIAELITQNTSTYR